MGRLLTRNWKCYDELDLNNGPNKKIIKENQKGKSISCLLSNSLDNRYMKILIIDDSGVMRRIHRNTLKEHNIPEEFLLDARDGEEAIHLSIENKIDLFLVDWNMPRLDGLEFVKQVRQADKYKSTPIIMVTSEAAKYNVIQAISAGVTDYVVKPIQGDILWDKISQYLQPRQSK